MSNQSEISKDVQFLLKQVIIDVSGLIIRPWLESMEYNFDSYWRELELSFTVSNNVEDHQLIELRNELLQFLNLHYPDDEFSFEWQAVFKRSNKIMDVLLPEDKLRDVDEKLVELSFS